MGKKPGTKCKEGSLGIPLDDYNIKVNYKQPVMKNSATHHDTKA